MKKFISFISGLIILFTSNVVFAGDYSDIEVLDTYISDSSVAFEVTNLNLENDGEYYYLDCQNLDIDRYINNRQNRREQPDNYVEVSSVQLMVGGLQPSTNYRCQISISLASGSLVGTKLEFITTLDSEYEDLYSDIGENHKYADAVMYLSSMGVFNGYSDGTFGLSKTINRAELLKIFVEARGFTVPEDGENVGDMLDISEHGNCFDDVTDQWFAPYVCAAKAFGWVTGYGDGTFKPEQEVNKVEALRMLMTTQSVETTDDVPERPFDDVPTDAWFAKYVAKAKEMGLLELTGGNYNPGNGMTRGSIAESLYRLLSI